MKLKPNQWTRRRAFIAGAMIILIPLLCFGAATVLPVFQGGTGAATFTAHGVIVGEGASPLTVTATGSSGQVLTSNGSSSDPTFQAAAGLIPYYQEVPAGTINGSNTTFTLAHTPTSATSVLLLENGLGQTQGAMADYTISSATITYNTAPPTGTLLLAQYH